MVVRGLVVLALAACGGAPTPAPPRPTPVPSASASTGPIIGIGDVDPSVPDDLAKVVSRAQHLGRGMLMFDQAASTATDVLLANHGEKGVVGYVVLPRPDGDGVWEVDFLVSAEPPMIGRRVKVPLLRRDAPSYETLDPPVAAGADVAAFFRARQAVIARVTNVIQPLNPIVLPEDDKLAVYLLANTNRPNVAVLGRHYRAHTSPDGKTVLDFEALSKGPIEMPFEDVPQGGQPAALMVTHIVSEAPLETHVFASLLYKLPVFVLTTRGLWKVDGSAPLASISLVDTKRALPRMP